MKDCSELMIDLAYSAVLFDDKKLAEEVLKLERRIDHLRDRLNVKVMLAVRDADDAEMGLGMANAAIAADKISDAAADVAYLVLRGIPLHKTVRGAVEKAEERVGRIKVSGRSVLVGKYVKDIHSLIGVDVIAISVADRWIINPEEGVRLGPDYVLIVRGSGAGIERLKALAVA